jgi:alanine transaminase
LERIKNSEYAVRGQIAIRAMEIEREMERGIKQKFDKIVHLNIGNPQDLGQKPLSFNREVLACCLYDDPIRNRDYFTPEAVDKADHYLSHLNNRAVGAYTDSPGMRVVMREVKDFIQKRDGVEVDEDNIYLLNGASEGITLMLRLLIYGEEDGIMIPTPQYPIYSALVTKYGGRMVKYFLDESFSWGLTYQELERSYANAVDKGINVKSIVVINPGNPTGQVFSEKDLERVLKFAHDKKLFVLADEVYQKNIYSENKKFTSIRKVLKSLGSPYEEDIEMASFHSLSKGLLGECGLRGGYMELHNVESYASKMIYKSKAVNLCSNTIGQIGVGLLVNPPTLETTSAPVFEKYEKEKGDIFRGLKFRAEILGTKLNEIEGISCNAVDGAMYAFPTIDLPQKYMDLAYDQDLVPDLK